MANRSTYMKFTYPEEYADPFWDDFEALIREADKATYMNKIKGNLIIGGGGSVVFNSVSGLLSWTEDFVIPLPQFGFGLTVSFGPDGATRQAGLIDGSALVVEIPFAMTQNETRTFSVVSQLTATSNTQWVAGIRIGDKVYFRGLAPVG
jgi:hypothetical protein